MEERNITFLEKAEQFFKEYSYIASDQKLCDQIRLFAENIDGKSITKQVILSMPLSDYYFRSFVFSSLNLHDDLDDYYLVSSFLQPEYLLNSRIYEYTCHILSNLVLNSNDIKLLHSQLVKKGFDEVELINQLGKYFSEIYFNQETFSSKNFKDLVKLCGNQQVSYEYIYRRIFYSGYEHKDTLGFLKLICENKLEFLNEERINKFIFEKKHSKLTEFNLGCISLLLSISNNYLKNIEACLDNETRNTETLDIINLFNLYLMLSKLKNEYVGKAVITGKNVLKEIFNNKQEKWTIRYGVDSSQEETSFSIAQFIIAQDRKNALEFFQNLVPDTLYFHLNLLKYLDGEYGNESMSLLVSAVLHHNYAIQHLYYERLFNALDKYDYRQHIDEILNAIVLKANKDSMMIACASLAKHQVETFEKAVALLNGKNNNQRMVGALILININNTESNQLLMETIDNEKNDDTRDIIVEALQKQIFTEDFKISEIKDYISKAANRGKLIKWNEKNIDETSLPPLYWNDGSTLFIEEVRFLFYRILRSKGLNSDIEARMTIKFLDKNRSEAFAKYILKSFNDTNQDIKLKHYLTLSAMLGGNESVVSFNALFKKAIVDKRARLAEIALESMAVIGNTKALRAIEVISRKMASKKPRISQLAIEALEAAAEELGIAKDQLEDRIVPDFDFEGTYKTFMVGDDEYRAFVANDFTIQYMDEDNKIKKSLPKEIDKDSKVFFTEMSKELKDVVKNQVGRLEKYLTIGRVWSMEEWFASYINHPIMSVFSQKLMWYTKGNDGMIKETFMVQEDTSLTNIEDEEITVSEDDKIGLLHPIFVNQTTLDAWGEKLYHRNFKTLISQLDRKVFSPNQSELEANICKTFIGKVVPRKADFTKSFMEKRGWNKQTGDGGHISFSKTYYQYKLRIEPYIEGVYPWYQNNADEATIHEVFFYQQNHYDKFLIKDVPPIIFSEVMNDLQDLLDAK
jgi:hypothetical protein